MRPHCDSVAEDNPTGQHSRSQQHAASEPEPGESPQDESENGEAQTEPSLMRSRHEQVIEKVGPPALGPNSTRNLTVEQRTPVSFIGVTGPHR
jgi:hypothetical protein